MLAMEEECLVCYNAFLRKNYYEDIKREVSLIRELFGIKKLKLKQLYVDPDTPYTCDITEVCERIDEACALGTERDWLELCEQYGGGKSCKCRVHCGSEMCKRANPMLEVSLSY